MKVIYDIIEVTNKKNGNKHDITGRIHTKQSGNNNAG